VANYGLKLLCKRLNQFEIKTPRKEVNARLNTLKKVDVLVYSMLWIILTDCRAVDVRGRPELDVASESRR
jgi:hypothetical protein